MQHAGYTCGPMTYMRYKHERYKHVRFSLGQGIGSHMKRVYNYNFTLIYYYWRCGTLGLSTPAGNNEMKSREITYDVVQYSLYNISV